MVKIRGHRPYRHQLNAQTLDWPKIFAGTTNFNTNVLGGILSEDLIVSEQRNAPKRYRTTGQELHIPKVKEIMTDCEKCCNKLKVERVRDMQMKQYFACRFHIPNVKSSSTCESLQ